MKTEIMKTTITHQYFGKNQQSFKHLAIAAFILMALLSQSLQSQRPKWAAATHGLKIGPEGKDDVMTLRAYSGSIFPREVYFRHDLFFGNNDRKL